MSLTRGPAEKPGILLQRRPQCYFFANSNTASPKEEVRNSVLLPVREALKRRRKKSKRMKGKLS